MEKLSRKHIITIGIIIIAIILLFITLSITAKKQNQNKNTIINTPKPTAPPEPIALVVIDPGHGGFDAGARGKITNVPESELNLKVSKLIKEQLEDYNIEVRLTHDQDTALADTKKADMKLRHEIMHQPGVTLTVSIHMNMFKDTTINGPMVFYTKNDQQSKELADSIMKELCNTLELPQRLTNMGDYYVIRNSEIPAVIVECGFLSNRADEGKLCDSAYQEKLATAISKAIVQYLMPGSDD